MTIDAAQPPATVHGHLRSNSLGLVNVLAQTTSELGPSASIAILVGLVAATAGSGSWLSWILATVFVLLTAFCFAKLASRYATSGGLPSLISRVGGPAPGLVVTLLIGAYGVGLAPFLSYSFGIYARDYVQLIGYHGASQWLVVLFGVVVIIGTALLCIRDVQLSTRVMLVIEVVSIVSIMILMIVTLVRHHGGVFDSHQLALRGSNIHDIFLGVVLAMLMFVTFECSTTLGHETRNSASTIPRSLYATVLISGGLLIFCSYVMTMAFSGTGQQLASSANPLLDIARQDGVNWMNYVIQFGVTAGILAGIIAFTNWVSRMGLTLSREGFFPAYFGEVDERHNTPKRVILALAAFELIVFVALSVTGHTSNLTVYGYFSSYFTLLYLAAYVVALLAVAVIAWRYWRQPLVLVCAVVGAVAFGYVIYNSVHPAPAYPLNIYTYAAGVTIVAVLIAGLAGLRKNGRLHTLGSSSTELG